MASDYEVLLRRGNGHNKTVTITDCYSEQEARETAESMYGMEALRVIWKGRSGGSTSSSTSSHSPSSQTSSESDWDPFAVIVGLGALFLLYFIIQFWWLIAICAIVGIVVYSVLSKDED